MGNSNTLAITIQLNSAVLGEYKGRSVILKCEVQGIFQEVKVCELGLKGNYMLARQGKGSVGRNLYVQRHGNMQHHGACPIVSHLIGTLGFGEWKDVVWAGIPDALLLAVFIFNF